MFVLSNFWVAQSSETRVPFQVSARKQTKQQEPTYLSELQIISVCARQSVASAESLADTEEAKYCAPTTKDTRSSLVDEKIQFQLLFVVHPPDMCSVPYNLYMQKD